jgi:hypothetical protein
MSREGALIKRFNAAVAFALLALVCLPAAAIAHIGSATVSCSGASFTWVDFDAGSNTVNYRIDVDSTTAIQGTFVLNEAGGTSGHLTVPLTLYDTHRVQANSWWGPAGTATGETRLPSSPALADQVVHCPAAPPAPIATPSAPAPPAVTSVAAPAVAVAGERVSSAPTPRLSVQEACAARHARVTVKGSSMRQVRFSVKGRHARTVAVAPGARRITALVGLRRGGPAAQKVTTRITFRNGAPARTLVAVARRCAPAAAIPTFTG